VGLKSAGLRARNRPAPAYDGDQHGGRGWGQGKRLRLIIGISRDVLPDAAVAALLRAIAVFDVLKTWTDEARKTDLDTNAASIRPTYALMLAGLLSGAVEPLCVAYNSVTETT
jgi:hypothetical protein